MPIVPPVLGSVTGSCSPTLVQGTDITLVEGTGTQALTLCRKCFPKGRAVPKRWAQGLPIPGGFPVKAAHLPSPLRDSGLWMFLKNRWVPPAKILPSSHLAWG